MTLNGLQVVSRAFARTIVLDDIVLDLLAFDQAAHAGTFDRRGVNEHIGRAIVRLDKAEAFGGIEELNGSGVHNTSFRSLWMAATDIAAASNDERSSEERYVANKYHKQKSMTSS
jgi:hypothetical protein